jgi:hypothetical protein
MPNGTQHCISLMLAAHAEFAEPASLPLSLPLPPFTLLVPTPCRLQLPILSVLNLFHRLCPSLLNLPATPCRPCSCPC